MSAFSKGKSFKKIILASIRVYQLFFSSGRACAFHPSCSQYSRQAVSKHGVLKGGWLGLKRILRCHPWQKNNYDPIE